MRKMVFAPFFHSNSVLNRGEIYLLGDNTDGGGLPLFARGNGASHFLNLRFLSSPFLRINASLRFLLFILVLKPNRNWVDSSS